MRDSFVFYRSFFEALQDVPNEERACIYDAICAYSLNDTEPNLTGMQLAIFKLIRPNIDANKRKYENGKKGANFGKKGGRPKKENPKLTPIKPQDNPSRTPNVDVDDDVRCIDVDKESTKVDIKKTNRFLKPTIQQLQDFISEKKYSVNAETFFNYYEANGWKVGKNPMKDWKAAVRTWQSNENPKRKSSEIGIVLRDNNPDKYADDKLW